MVIPFIREPMDLYSHGLEKSSSSSVSNTNGFTENLVFGDAY